jgi:hypothetical protein
MCVQRSAPMTTYNLANFPELLEALNKATNGEQVNVALNIDSLTDVAVDNVEEGQGLVWDESAGEWTNQSISPSSPVSLTAGAVDQVPLTLTGAASQTGDLLEINSHGNTGGDLVKVDKDGTIWSGTHSNFKPAMNLGNGFRLAAYDGRNYGIMGSGTAVWDYYGSGDSQVELRIDANNGNVASRAKMLPGLLTPGGTGDASDNVNGVWFCAGTPDDSKGVDGDYCFQSDANKVWYKSGGAWA